MRKEAELGEETAKQAVVGAMGEHDAVIFDGQPIYNTLVDGRMTLDKKAITRDYPNINFALYEKKGKPYRTFKPYLREEA